METFASHAPPAAHEDAIARCEILERELRALQAAERASRARETALACELETRRRRARAGRRATETDDDDESEYGGRRAIGASASVPSREYEGLRERCEAAEARARRATETLAQVAAERGEMREKAASEAVENAVREAEEKWRAEMEELSRAARADARALSSSRNRAGELAAELREAKALRDEWQKRAEAAMETSEATSDALERMRKAIIESENMGLSERSVKDAERIQKLVKQLATTQEQLAIAQREVHKRDSARDRLVFDAQKAQERVKEISSRLAEVQAEREHAKETVSVERAEKERLNGEVVYLRGELDRIRSENENEMSDFTDWRTQTEKTYNRELNQARKDAARHAMTVRKLQQKLAQGKDASDARKIAQLERECATVRETVRELVTERDALARRVQDLTSFRSDARHQKGSANARRAVVAHDDDEVDDNIDPGAFGVDDDLDISGEDDEDDDIFNEATENLFKETVDDFFEDDDAEDARLEAAHAHAHALAKRLQSIESRAVAFLGARDDFFEDDDTQIHYTYYLFVVDVPRRGSRRGHFSVSVVI